MNAWILAARPKTLLAGVAPVWVGCDLALVLAGRLQLWLGICTLLSAVSIQVATNFFNDAIDFHKGADGLERRGPQRATASGLLSARRVLAGSVAMLVVACLWALPMIAARGWPVLAIGIPSLYFSFGYTGGPVPLAYRGLGELFVIVFFGLIAVAGTYYVQTGLWPVDAVVAGIQVGALSTVLIAVNNLRDIDEDRRSGKRTLAVRLGKRFAQIEILLLTFVPLVMGIYWGVLREPAMKGVALAPLLAVPLSLVLVQKIFRTGPGPGVNRCLGIAALQLLLFAALFSAGLRW